jgi:uncharacterized protein DUF892
MMPSQRLPLTAKSKRSAVRTVPKTSCKTSRKYPMPQGWQPREPTRWKLEPEEHDEKGPILDLVIVAGMQRIEHYEIAAYGTNVALAEALGEKQVAKLLSETLEEEKQTDLKLTEVTQKAIMPEALTGEEEEEEGGDERGGGRSGRRRKAA